MSKQRSRVRLKRPIAYFNGWNMVSMPFDQAIEQAAAYYNSGIRVHGTRESEAAFAATLKSLTGMSERDARDIAHEVVMMTQTQLDKAERRPITKRAAGKRRRRGAM